MIENIPQNEGGAEKIPNEREVLNKFQEIIGSADYAEIEKIEDEQGLQKLAIQTVDATGDQLDIFYIRTMTDPDGDKRPSRIHQTLYMGDTPCGSGTQYDYIDGQWVERP